MPERNETIKAPKINEVKKAPEGVKNTGETLHRESGIPKEVRSWMEEVEKRPSVNVHDDNSGQTVLQVSDSSDDKYKLPIKRVNFIEGFKENLQSAARWFSVFVLRVIKKRHGKVEFKQEDE